MSAIELENNNSITLYEDWDKFNLKEEVHRGLLSYGFEKPTAIQQKAIKPLIDGRDIVGQAQSGTGKTGAFTVGTLQRVDVSQQSTQVIILSNTHILAKQTFKVINDIAKYCDGIVTKLLIGKTAVSEDINELRARTPHVIVGTPGRVYDMMKRRHFDTSQMKLFIMDEADEMLQKGFKDQIYEIFKYFNDSVQIALFSATMPSDILILTEKFMRDPVKIILKADQVTLKGIKQFHVALPDDQGKFDCLKDLFEIISTTQTIIYAKSCERVTRLYNAMISDGFTVCSVHSDMLPADRDETIEKFKNGQYRVLISSAMTSRGFDVQQVSTVIIFDVDTFANNLENYVHAIGRSGRFGRKGLAINFVTKQDMDIIKAIESKYSTNIDELPQNIADYV